MKTACVILAAGLGKRMRSRYAKVLHPVCGEPMIYYSVALALQRRFDPVVVVVGNQAKQVQEFLVDRFGKRVCFVLQDPPLGTGHAVAMTKTLLAHHQGKTAILYGDVPLLSGRELSVLAREGRDATVAFLTGRLDNPTGYGRVVRDEHGEVVRIVEERDADASQKRLREINTGFYLVDTVFAFSCLEHLRRSNAQGEFYLTDLVEAARRAGHKVKGIELPQVETMLGVNDRRELARAEALLNQRLVGRLLDNGVTVTDPARTYLGPQVRVGKDTVIHPGCWLRGKVRIGEGCVIGPDAVILDSTIGPSVEIRPFSSLQECRIGARAIIGPFARIRPATVLAQDVHVGNFVEIKKSTLGKGSKANHLSYLGDSHIGARVNVGAGTITCNYDGVHKHKTVIEDGVFIGSDTQLVAPVCVGKNAVVGAGTTVTSDVPPGSLAISRTKQSNIKGYAKRRHRHG